MKKFVIVNADDLGISIGTNKAIEKAYQKGILTSASLMPNGPAFADAVEIVKRCSGLGVGIHLSLTWGKAILPKDKIPHLVDRQGYFYPSTLGLFLKTLFYRSIKQEVKAELEAQIKTVEKVGIEPDHLDGQSHFHFIPAIFPIVRSLAKQYQIKFIRLPIEPLFSFPFSRNLFKWSLLQVFGWIINYQGHLPQNYPRFYGILYTSGMTAKIFERIFAKTKQGVTEIALHPGFYDLGKVEFDFQRQNIDTSLKSKSHLLELKALVNQNKKILAKKYKICLTTFARITAQK